MSERIAEQHRLSRRRLLLSGAAGAGALGLGALAGSAATSALAGEPEPSAAPLNGSTTVPFFGEHQAGVTEATAHATFVALDLLPGTDGAAIGRMLRILSDDAARLMAGEPALADTEPELALTPARLSVVFGFGPELVRRVAGESRRPSWLGPLPAFTIDRLEDRFSHGDLMLRVGSDDPTTLAHALRMLLKDSRSFATVRWMQSGFASAYGSAPAGTTMRNLFGQVDGTENPVPDTEWFDEVVWARSGWLAGGTSMVLRRIAMNLDTWDELDRAAREQVMGRNLANGAPLTGVHERDPVDFDARDERGVPVIAPFSHVRRARSDNPRERIFRQAYNYQETPQAGQISDAGLLFVSYQADVDRQFVPIQRRLDELDLLNEWTTPVGSAVFAIPPGCAPGGFVGETLFA